jgi:hypothetical protein
MHLKTVYYSYRALLDVVEITNTMH